MNPEDDTDLYFNNKFYRRTKNIYTFCLGVIATLILMVLPIGSTKLYNHVMELDKTYKGIILAALLASAGWLLKLLITTKLNSGTKLDK